MSDLTVKPLGKILQQAGLISTKQLETAQKEQSGSENLGVGEVLVRRGLIDQATVDFFTQEWLCLLSQQQPLGKYFREAGLLDRMQLEAILEEQKHTGRIFGEIAVCKGWLKQITIDFFVKHLDKRTQELERRWPEAALADLPPSEIDAGIDEVASWKRLTEEVQLQTNGHRYLTQTLCQFLGEYHSLIPAGEEARWVDEVIRTHIVENWEQGAASERLRQIRDRLLSCHALLSQYEQILQQKIPGDRSLEPTLLELELVAVHQDRWSVHNCIYAQIFSLTWVEQAKASLQQSASELIATESAAFDSQEKVDSSGENKESILSSFLQSGSPRIER